MRLPKDDKRFHWTSHVKDKMLFYRIPESRVKAILKSPDRREEGIAPNTVAAMKRNDTKKRTEELWIMYQTGAPKKQDEKSLMKIIRNSKFIIISAWRYPGKTKPGDRIPVPDDIAEELGLM